MSISRSAGQDEAIRVLRQAAACAVATPPAVLLVDDEAEVVDELAGLLRRRGLRVLSAGSAEAALDLLQRHAEIAVLVTDIRLPGLDGLALAAAALDDRPEAEAVEVLLMTGHASAAQSRAATRLGAFGVLLKPMRGAELARMVQDALARTALRRGGATGFGWVPRPTAALPPIPAPAPWLSCPRPAARHVVASSAVALLERLALRIEAEGETLAAIARDLAGPLGDLLRAAAPAPAGSTGLLRLLDELLDLVALEAGDARPCLAPVPVAALADAVAARLSGLGLRCARQSTLGPGAEPRLLLDLRRILRALELIAPEGTGDADLAIEAGSGRARLDLLMRPASPSGAGLRAGSRAGPHQAGSQLGHALAGRLVLWAGGRLDCWPGPGGAVRVRLQVRGP